MAKSIYRGVFDATKSYPIYSIVNTDNSGDSTLMISVQEVPVGSDITDADYWITYNVANVNMLGASSGMTPEEVQEMIEDYVGLLEELDFEAYDIVDAINFVNEIACTQADWEQSDDTAVDYIKNKPTIPDAQVQANWNETDTDSKAYIQNKPTIPDAQVQADWDEADSSSMAYIQNKPTIPPTITVDSAISATSENPVQNKVITQYISPVLGLPQSSTVYNFVTSDSELPPTYDFESEGYQYVICSVGQFANRYPAQTDTPIVRGETGIKLTSGNLNNVILTFAVASNGTLSLQGKTNDGSTTTLTGEWLQKWYKTNGNPPSTSENSGTINATLNGTDFTTIATISTSDGYTYITNNHIKYIPELTVGNIIFEESVTTWDISTTYNGIAPPNPWQDIQNRVSALENATLPIATTSSLGTVIADGTTITVDGNGVISAVGGGSSVQADWAETDPADDSFIQNKPFDIVSETQLFNDTLTYDATASGQFGHTIYGDPANPVTVLTNVDVGTEIIVEYGTTTFTENVVSGIGGMAVSESYKNFIQGTPYTPPCILYMQTDSTHALILVIDDTLPTTTGATITTDLTNREVSKLNASKIDLGGGVKNDNGKLVGVGNRQTIENTGGANSITIPFSSIIKVQGIEIHDSQYTLYEYDEPEVIILPAVNETITVKSSTNNSYTCTLAYNGMVADDVYGYMVTYTVTDFTWNGTPYTDADIEDITITISCLV